LKKNLFFKAYVIPRVPMGSLKNKLASYSAYMYNKTQVLNKSAYGCGYGYGYGYICISWKMHNMKHNVDIEDIYIYIF